MLSVPFEIVKQLLAAWESGSRRIRFAIVLSTLLLGTGVITYVIADNFLFGNRIWRLTGMLSGGVGSIVALVIISRQKGKEEEQQERKIEEVERRVKEHPKETQAAWELARVTLEKYLNRNLSQVRSIFWLTALVMTTGFTLIIVGAYEAFQDSQRFNASILTTVSGVVVTFIGGTFLVIYKSTMAQAKDYVMMLERINAVGMSVQVLEALNDGGLDIKYETTADIARQLLMMYSMEAPRVNRSRRKPKANAADT
jgi:hypothetical protein